MHRSFQLKSLQSQTGRRTTKPCFPPRKRTRCRYLLTFYLKLQSSSETSVSRAASSVIPWSLLLCLPVGPLRPVCRSCFLLQLQQKGSWLVIESKETLCVGVWRDGWVRFQSSSLNESAAAQRYFQMPDLKNTNNKTLRKIFFWRAALVFYFTSLHRQ